MSTVKKKKFSDRKEVNSKILFTTVKWKWISFCKDNIIKNGIHPIIDKMNKIKYEAYLLANFHILRIINHNLEIPKLDQTFFKRTCNLVSSFEKRKTNPCKDIELDKSSKMFLELKLSKIFIYREKLNQLISIMALEMETAIKNHIIINAEKRILRYIRLTKGLKKYHAWGYLKSVFESTNLSEEDQKFKDFIGFMPYESNIKSNFNHFLILSYKILQYIESLPERTKGAKLYSILPTKSSFVNGHITIDTTALADILSIFSKKSVHAKEFRNNRDSEWRNLFNLNSVETKNRRFHYQISTDGYSVSILLTKPSIKESKMIYEYDHLIGIDPGITYLFTGKYSENGKEGFVRGSGAEYRFKNKTSKFNKWSQKKVKGSEIEEILKGMPSLKTSSFEKYSKQVVYHLAHSEKLFEFYNKHPYQKWRFTSFFFRKKTISEFCNRIAPKGKKTLVGFGDWSVPQGMSFGKPSGAVEGLKSALKRVATVVNINEHNTSKECSCCGSNIKNLYFKNKDQKLTFSHQVIRCINNDCMISWQRDKNASSNIYSKLRDWLSKPDQGDKKPNQTKT